MPEPIQEYVDSGSHRLRVDRTAGVIRGVKLLGLRSRNGRRYREQALAQAVNLYEGAKVNINHPKGHPLSPRDYQDRLGMISNVEFRPDHGLFGDLHFNPKHTLSEQLMWDAEHASQNVGLSHNVLASTKREGDETVVEAITQVQSIDLVADPATTRGLFEQQTPREPITWDSLSHEQLALHRPDLLAELESHSPQLTALETQLELATAREALIQRRARIAELLQEHNLPLPTSQHTASRQIVGEQFVATLLATDDDETLRRLVADRAALVQSAARWHSEQRQRRAQPQSRDQLAFGNTHLNSTHTAQEFASAIRNS